MKKSPRFSKIEEQIIVESLKRNMTAEEIAESLGREAENVRFKIWRMGLKTNKVFKERVKLTPEERQRIRERAKAREQEDVEEVKNLRASIHPYLDSDWQEVLIVTGTRMTDWKGQRILMMDGMPTSIQAIREKYARITAASSLGRQGASAGAQPCQSKRQSTEKVVPIQCNR